MTTNSRGFIQLSPLAWGAIGAMIIIVALTAAVKIQTSRLETAQGERDVARSQLATFKAETKRLGDEAARAAKAREAQDRKDKEKADAENKDLRRELDARRRQLRDRANSAGGSLVPAPGPAPRSPDTVTFDRSLLDRALREYEAEVEGLIGEGAEAVIDLDTAKQWGKKR